MPAIDKTREDNRDLSVILNDLSNKEEKVVTIKNELYLISIPEGYDEVYVILENILTFMRFI